MHVSIFDLRDTLSRRSLGLLKFTLLCLLAYAPVLQGQQAEPTSDSEKQTVQLLLQRIDSLEASQKQLLDRIAKLEKTQAGSPAGVAAAASQTGMESVAPSEEQEEMTEQ